MNTENPGLLRRNPIVAFLIFAFVLPVPILLVPYLDLPFEPLIIYASWTPNLAAFLVLGVILRQKGGVRQLVSGWGIWKVQARWYLAAVSPLIMAFLVAAIYIALGGRPLAPDQPVWFPILLSLILSLVTGAMGEELGWRGFLLPRLQQRFNALISSLIVGLIWALWHLSLWTLPDQVWIAIPYAAFALAAISTSVLFTWILNNTGGSLLLATIMHWMMNFGMNAILILGLIPSPRDGWIIASIVFTVFTVAVVVYAGPNRLSKELNRYAPMKNHK